MASRGSAYRFNVRLGRYIDPAGRMVSSAKVRAELDRALASAERSMAAISQAFSSGQISLSTWRLEMRRLVRNVHLYSAAAAQGGWAQMTQQAYGRVGGLIRFHYSRLNRFAMQLAKGLPIDLNRVRLYAQAARDTYEWVRGVEMERRGYDEEKNVMDRTADHCIGADSCEEQTDKGWVKRGMLLPVGRRRCTVKCRCRLVYRKSSEPKAAAA